MTTILNFNDHLLQFLQVDIDLLVISFVLQSENFKILFKMAPRVCKVTWGQLRSRDSPEVLPPCGSVYTPVI